MVMDYIMLLAVPVVFYFYYRIFKFIRSLFK